MARIIISGPFQHRLTPGLNPGPILRLVPPAPVDPPMMRTGSIRNLDDLQEIRTMKGDDYSSVCESDREEIIQMIGFGWTDDEILQMMPHIEKGSVTAFRAHVTRGTYDLGVINGNARGGANR